MPDEFESGCGSLSDEEDEDLLACENCGSEFDPDEMVGFDSDMYCEDCFDTIFTFCTNCAETIYLDDSVYHGYDHFCRSCFEDIFVECYDCGEIIWQDDACYSDDACASVCERCYNENDHDNSSHGDIREWDYKPRIQFFSDKRSVSKGVPAYGVETEINVGNNTYRECLSVLNRDNQDNFFYFMEDGSIHHGFEIATMPFTYGYMMKNKKKWNSLWELREMGCKSYDASECGTHVHVNKASFYSGLHLLKFSKFFFRNPRFITEVSRRSGDRLDEWARLNEPSQLSKMIKDDASDGRRYRAVNLCPTNTAEVRIFRGTLSPIGYFGNIEFVDSVFRFTNDAGLQDLTVDKYLPYLYENSKKYPLFTASLGQSLAWEKG